MNSPFRALFATLFTMLFATLLFSVPAHALVDLISPEQDATESAANMTFEYYVSLENVESCTLSIDTATFPDTTIVNNAFNTFTVVSIDPGIHQWRITCQNATASDYSVVRTLIIDRTAPVVAITSPAEGTTVQGLALVFAVTDDRSSTLSCSVNANGTFLTSVNVQSGLPAALNLSVGDGAWIVMVTCLDSASNAGSSQRTITVKSPPPALYLSMSMIKSTYALGESVLLAIDTLNGANLSIEICPDGQGFVQCYTPLITGSFPQTVVLPYTNRTGRYIVDGVSLYGNQTKTNHTNYTVENTMGVTIGSDRTPTLDRQFVLTATTTGAIGAVTYRWTMSNGTNVTGSQMARTYTTIGTFAEWVRATDSAGNNATAYFTAKIEPEFSYAVTVLDAVDGKPVVNATVQIELEEDDEKRFVVTTDSDGEALFELVPETYKIFISKSGYAYYLNETNIEADKTETIYLVPYDNEKPVITILGPEEGADVSIPVQVRYTIQDKNAVNCELSYAKIGDQWLQQAGTQTIISAAEQVFEMTSLEEATYQYVIACVDASENRIETPPRTFAVHQQALTPEEAIMQTGFDNDPLEVIDRAYGAYDSFSSEQRILADMLGWEQTLKEQKRIIERTSRDLDSLQFRRDLSDDDKTRQSAELQKKIDDASKLVPLDLIIHDSSSRVDYLEEQNLAALAPAIRQQKGYAFTDGQLAKYLQEVQQDFTMETKLTRATILLADGAKRPLGIVEHSFRYKARSGTKTSTDGEVVVLSNGGFSGDYTIYELIPDNLASTPEAVKTVSERNILNRQPIALEFGPEQQIVYYIESDVSLDALGGVKTVLLRKPSQSDLEAITGNVLFSFLPAVDWKLSVILSAALIIIIFLLRGGLFRRLQYLFYAKSGKKDLHEFRTLVNDGVSHLEANDVEGAMMRYKEAKLSYEQLTLYAQNEVFDDLERFRKLMDASYFTILSDRIREAMAQGHFADAIDDFSRLEGTYERLDPKDQEDLYILILELGRRLGLEENGSMPSASGSGWGGVA